MKKKNEIGTSDIANSIPRLPKICVPISEGGTQPYISPIGHFWKWTAPPGGSVPGIAEQAWACGCALRIRGGA